MRLQLQHATFLFLLLAAPLFSQPNDSVDSADDEFQALVEELCTVTETSAQLENIANYLLDKSKAPSLTVDSATALIRERFSCASIAFTYREFVREHLSLRRQFSYQLARIDPDTLAMVVAPLFDSAYSAREIRFPAQFIETKAGAAYSEIKIKQIQDLERLSEIFMEGFNRLSSREQDRLIRFTETPVSKKCYGENWEFWSRSGIEPPHTFGRSSMRPTST